MKTILNVLEYICLPNVAIKYENETKNTLIKNYQHLANKFSIPSIYFTHAPLGLRNYFQISESCVVPISSCHSIFYLYVQNILHVVWNNGLSGEPCMTVFLSTATFFFYLLLNFFLI